MKGLRRHRSVFMLVAPLAVLVTLSVTSASAAPSLVKPGCPAVTRAQAEAAIGDVRRIEHHSQRTPFPGAPGGGLTSLQYCEIYFGPGFKKTRPTRYGGYVEIAFDADDRKAWNERRKAYASLARAAGTKLKTVGGLGKDAFRYAPDIRSAESELHVFHPYLRWSPPGIPAREAGAFVLLARGGAGEYLPFQTLVALARAALKYPKR